MAIHVDTPELEQILERTPASQNILLIGKHGIGKSEILTASYTARGLRVVPFFLGQMSDPGDLLGLMHKDEATGRSVFLPPFWWPDPGQPIVLFLDELNRARPEILQAVQDLTLNRTLAGRALPDGSRVIAAVNEGEEYQLTDLDPALVSRFNVYTFAPTIEDWLVWAGRGGLDPRVVRFIQKNPGQLDGGTSAAEAWKGGIEKTADRRAWARVARLIERVPELDKLHVKLIAGIVGTPAALALQRSLAEGEGLGPEHVLLALKDNERQLRALSLPAIILLDEAIVHWIDAGQLKAEDTERARKNLLAWLKLLQKDKKQEAIAHFASLLESKRFTSVMRFAASSLDLMNFLVEYIAAIKV